MSDMKRIYIAGPMSGLPEFNFPAFNAVAKHFRDRGWVVFNPAEKEVEKTINNAAYETGDSSLAIKEGFNFREVYMWDLEKVVVSDAIYMLEGWENSPGARGEHAVAIAVKKHYPDYQILYAA